MALLIKPDGDQVVVRPQDGYFSLEEMYDYLECGCVQIIALHDGRLMWIDEEGKLKPHRINPVATELLARAGGIPGDYIAGSALVTEISEIE